MVGETDMEVDFSMKVDEESAFVPYQKQSNALVNRNKVMNGFKCKNKSDVSSESSEQRKNRDQDIAKALPSNQNVKDKTAADLPPQVVQGNLKLSRKRLDKVMNEHKRNEGFRREYRANEITGRLNQTLVCNLCQAPFKKLCNMKDHLRMHKGEKPYECRLCGLKFAQQGNRDRHEKRKICILFPI